MLGTVIAVVAAVGSASGRTRSNNTYTGKFVHVGKTTYLVSHRATGNFLAKASVRGGSEFYALDKLLLDEEAKMNNCTTSVGMKKHLDIMEAAMWESGHTIPDDERSFYDKMMNDARESYKTQIEDEKHDDFDKRFENDIGTLECTAEELTHWDFSTCDSGDAKKRDLVRIRTKILEYAAKNDIYDHAISYMASVLDLPETTIKDEGAFAEYYQSYINGMKGEGQRKKLLIDKVVKAVPEDGYIKRSELMRQFGSEMPPEELRICYKQAVERKRVLEEKIGSYYYVSRPKKNKRKIQSN